MPKSRRTRAKRARAASAHAKQALRKKRGIRWLKISAVFLVCNVALFAASWLSLFNSTRVDDWLERHFRSYASVFTTPKPNRRVVLICAEQDPQKNGTLGEFGIDWRQYHAKLVEALKGHAKVIAFDLKFDLPSRWDAEMAKAFKDAEDAGTRVILGTGEFNVKEGTPSPDITSTLDSFLTRDRWASLTTGGHVLDSKVVRHYRMAQRIDDESASPIARLDAVPSLALQIFRASQGSAYVIFDHQKGNIELQDKQFRTLSSMPVDDELFAGLDLIDRSNIAELPYNLVYESREQADSLKKFDNQLVLIGFKQEGVSPKGDEFFVSDSETRFGIEIHANALMNLMAGEWPHLIPAWIHYGLIVLMSIAAIVLQTQTKPWMRYKVPIEVKWIPGGLQIPVSLFCMLVIYCLGMLVAFMFYRVTLGSSYHVGSLFVTYFLAGIVIK